MTKNKYNNSDDEFLQKYFEICQRIWEDMEESGLWPWDVDSQISEDLLESKDNPTIL